MLLGPIVEKYGNARVDFDMCATFERWLASVKAEAPREAGDWFWKQYPNGQTYNGHRVADLLYQKAEKIEKEAGR